MRSSHFSLEFPMIGPSNSDETRGKVDPHCKSYVLVPVLWSFDKLREVGVFCHAPDPGPTRLANPNRFRVAKPYTGTPYILFSAEIIPVSIQLKFFFLFFL